MISKNQCVGCTACANICPEKCITMKKDIEGFYYPFIEDKNCIKCGLCDTVCPINFKIKNISFSQVAYAAYSNDEKIRFESSSGGIFSEIAKFVLENSGVVYGASYGNDFNVCHICIDDVNDLYKLRGAKYAESELGNSFSDIKEKLMYGKYVLFAGTPCQVVGLRSFLKHDYENLICIDFICHGIPSSIVWEKYLDFKKSEDNETELPCQINLRYKKSGWSKYRYSVYFLYKDGKESIIKNSENLYINLFVGDYINRLSCSKCNFKGNNRASDITLGDFWGIWDIYPEMDDDKGTSAVIIQSVKGNKIWGKIKNNIQYKSVTVEQIGKQNPSLSFSSDMNTKREKILKFVLSDNMSKCEKMIASKNVSKFFKFKDIIKKYRHIKIHK